MKRKQEARWEVRRLLDESTSHTAACSLSTEGQGAPLCLISPFLTLRAFDIELLKCRRHT